MMAEENAFHFLPFIVLSFFVLFLIFSLSVVFIENRKEDQENPNYHHPDAFYVSGPQICSSWFSPSWNDEEYKRKAMACFVQAAYAREHDRQEKQLKRTDKTSLAPMWGNHFHFKVTKSLIDPHDESIIGVILIRNWLAALRHFILLRPGGGAPKAVLALRGTLLTKATRKCDLQHDLKFFAIESLEGTVRYKLVFDALASLVARYGEKNVCVAGHSLGAAYALQVAKALADREMIVDTHIFNPPSPSLAKCIGSIVKVSYKPFSLFKWMLDLFKAQSEKNKGNTVMKIWQPNLYVNPSDRLCRHYIFGPGAEKLFMLSKKKQTILEAHSLKQWWSDDLEFETS